MKFVSYCNKVIEYSFYGIFFFVPLLFSQYTSELFELNKIWTLYGFAILILGAWLTKMVLEKEIRIQRSLFDIPLMLFLASQIIATMFSLDQHVSFYGYYSRFNGGLLSTIVYIFLYYAFVSNLTIKHVWRGMLVIVWTGVIVALWGLPSHFGADPTCLLFRGTLDTSCWTDAFHPTSRIFSTLGQPAWLAAYLAFLIPLAMFYMLKNEKNTEDGKANPWWFWTYAGVAALFFVDLIFANTRAGYIGFLFGYLAFWALVWYRQLAKKKKILLIAIYALASGALLFATLKSTYWSMHLLIAVFLIALLFLKRQYLKTFLTINIAFLLLLLIFNTPLGSLGEPLAKFIPATTPPPQSTTAKPAAQPAVGTVLETNITDSGDIRKIVWKGAIDIWKAHPLFGSGVETYAFAYYQHRPAAHNLTSEWDYLYNKAHNEYLNYLATTGAFGLISYLLIIGFVGYVVIKTVYELFTKNGTKKKDHDTAIIPTANYLLIAALSAGFVSILISNFFGFSVVIINLYFFLTPAFLLLLTQELPEKYLRFSVNRYKSENYAKQPFDRVNVFQWSYITIIFIIVVSLFLTLFRTWNADKAYALGYNLSRAGDFQNSYLKLNEAVKLRPAEPTFRDEYAVTNATIASALFDQKDSTNAAQFANQAIVISDDLTTHYPNNIIFWKDRFKVYYLLASSPSDDQENYRQQAIYSLEKAHTLAPTDAKLLFNLGVLYRDSGNSDQAIAALTQAVQLKPDYRDAYYALGISYHAKALNPNGTIKDPALEQKAVQIMEMIIEKFGKDSDQAKKSLQEWSVLGASSAANTIK